MRQRLQQVKQENFWSDDMLAMVLGTNVEAPRRWMMEAPPENTRHLADLIDVERKVERYLATYKGPALIKRTPDGRGGKSRRRFDQDDSWMARLSRPSKVGFQK